jgi:hypothetical protein
LFGPVARDPPAMRARLTTPGRRAVKSLPF